MIAGFSLSTLLIVAASSVASAAPVNYEIDPAHTYPSFEADHMGISVWRGKFNASSGSVTLDKAAGTGTVDVSIDITSVDFGHDEMNAHARRDDILDATSYPTAHYRGKLTAFVEGAPTRVEGDLTLHGITRPLDLKVAKFRCIEHPLHKRTLCGADAHASIDRAEFGIDAGRDYGFDMNVALRIQVEAVAVP